jgi:hypothetical protein
MTQLMKQNAELQLSSGRIVYTKRGIFGMCYSMKIQANPEVVKNSSIFKPCEDQFKSGNYNIEYPPVIVDQWSHLLRMMDILHWQSGRPLGWPQDSLLTAKKVGYDKPFLYKCKRESCSLFMN